VTPAATRYAKPLALVRPALRIETVSRYEEFLRLEPVWNECVRAAAAEHPFLEHSWVRTWWECFGADSTLNILLVREGEEIIAIAPLILTFVRMFGVTVKRLGFFYNSHVPRADFIIAARPQEAYAAIWNHLRSESHSWDLLQLCQLEEGSTTLEEMRTRATHDGYFNDVWLSGASPYVPLNTSWREYCDGLTAKHRSNLRNRFKRLNQTGTVKMETIASGESLPEALDAGLCLEAAAWKRDAGTAISCDPNIQKFYETFARRASEKNWLRLNFLWAGVERVAFDYSLEYNNEIFLLKLGYDPAFSAYSPSNLLLSMALESAFEQRSAKYDFLGENADWKRAWTKDETANYWLFVFSKTLKGRWLHFLKFRAIPWVKAHVRKEA